METGKGLLALIIELIDSKACWWRKQALLLSERTGEEDLSSWLSFARNASKPDAVRFALRKFVSQVGHCSHAWLEDGEDWDIRATLFQEVRQVLGLPQAELCPGARSAISPQKTETPCPVP